MLKLENYKYHSIYRKFHLGKTILVINPKYLVETTKKFVLFQFDHSWINHHWLYETRFQTELAENLFIWKIVEFFGWFNQSFGGLTKYFPEFKKKYRVDETNQFCWIYKDFYLNQILGWIDWNIVWFNKMELKKPSLVAWNKFFGWHDQTSVQPCIISKYLRLFN